MSQTKRCTIPIALHVYIHFERANFRFAIRSPLCVLGHYRYSVKSIRCHRTCRAASMRTERLKMTDRNQPET